MQILWHIPFEDHHKFIFFSLSGRDLQRQFQRAKTVLQVDHSILNIPQVLFQINDILLFKMQERLSLTSKSNGDFKEEREKEIETV